MKKVLLILAMAFISAMTLAQTTEFFDRDTITMEKMMVEFATLNNQVRDFRNLQLEGLAVTVVGAGISLYSSMQIADLAGQTPTTTYSLDERDKKLKTAKIANWIGYGTMAVGGILSLTGIIKLKRDRFEITPNGVIIKLTPYE